MVLLRIVPTVVMVSVCLLSSLGEYAKHVNSYSGYSFYYISCYYEECRIVGSKPTPNDSICILLASDRKPSLAP